MAQPGGRYFTSEGEPITRQVAVSFIPYLAGAGPVLRLKDMPPEKQKEMLDLYSEPGYSERLKNKVSNGTKSGV